MTDVATAQTRQSKTVSVPKIESVEQPQVDSLYKQAVTINQDTAFTAEDFDINEDYADTIKDDFDHVAQEIQSLIDDGNLEDANHLLEVLNESVRNTHYNLSELLESAKRFDEEADIIPVLESRVKDLVQVRDSIHAQQNILARQLGVIETLESRVSDNPYASMDRVDSDVVIRVTQESEELSTAREKAVLTRDGLLDELGLNGKTEFNIDTGGDKITVETTTRITLN